MKLNTILRWGIISGLFILPFIVLFVSNTLFFPFITGKNFAFRIIVEIVAVLWLILVSRDKTYRPRWSPLLISLVTFLGLIGLADIFSPNPAKSFWSNFERMEGLVTHIHLVLYFIIAGAVLTTEKLWTWFWNTSIGVSVIAGIYGIVQLLGFAEIHQGSVRLDASFGNATYLAVYMLFHIFLCLFFIVKKETRKYARFAYGAVALLDLFILYHTATRGAILGLIGGLFISAVLIAIFEKERILVKRAAIGVIAGIALLVGGFLAIRNVSFVAQSPVLSRFSSISVSERTTISRFLIWQMAWQGFIESPKTMLIGWGQESFNYVFNKYYDARMYNQEQWFDRAHNIIFDWLIAGGALGLLSYLSIFVLSLYLLWKKSGTRFSFAEKSIFTGLFIGYFFNNIFVFDNITSYLLFFAVLAFIHHSYCEAHPLPQTPVAGLKKKDEKVSEISEYAYTIVAPIVIIIFGFVFYFADWKPVATAQTLIRALPGRFVDAKTGQNLPDTEVADQKLKLFKKALAYNTFGVPEIREQLAPASSQVVSLKVTDEVKSNFLGFAKAELEKQIAKTPRDTRYEVFLGSFLARYGLFDEGLAHLEKALALSPEKQTIMFEIGGVLINKKDYDKAVLVLEKAFNLEPEYAEARVMYALAAIYAGKQVLADSILLPILGTTAPFDDRLVQAYIDTNQYVKLINILDVRIAANPKDYQLYLSKAAAYLKLGRSSDAIAEVQKVIDLNPDFKVQGEEFLKQIREGKI